MKFSRCMRGVGSAVAALLLIGISSAQQVFVNIETGNDVNLGQTAATAVQTITRALQIAAGNLTISWKIQVAGRTDNTGTVLAYDDNSGTTPPSAETFPLQMLRDVTLVWDQANSELLPGAPPVLARPLIQSTGAFLPTLVEFSFPGAAPNAPVTVSGIDFEGGQPAVSIPGNPNGAVAVVLKDVRIRDSERCVLSDAGASEVDVKLISSLFELEPPVPTSIVGNQPLVEVRAGFSTGSVTLLVDGCSFRATGNIAPPGGLRLLAGADASLTARVVASLFVGGPNGLPVGIDLVTALLSAGAPDLLRVDATVSGCTFQDCSDQGMRFQFTSTGGAGAAGDSALSVTGCTFDGNGGPAQLSYDVWSGNRLTLGATSNRFLPSGTTPLATDGILLVNNVSGIYTTGPTSTVSVDFSQNLIRDQKGDGIRIVAGQMAITGTISRNQVSDCLGDGIDHSAVWNLGAQACTSTVSIVNNMIGFNGGNGILNHVFSPGGVPAGAALVAAPTGVTHNTVYQNGLFGLQNQVDPAGLPMPAFPVYNSVFWLNASGDINTANLQELANIFFTDFFGSTVPGNGNLSQPPMLQNPAARDLRLATGSPMRDVASLTPPASPPVDFDGNLRRIDLPGVGNNGPLSAHADMGADERTIP